jgi:hypothetical protein
MGIATPWDPKNTTLGFMAKAMANAICLAITYLPLEKVLDNSPLGSS